LCKCTKQTEIKLTGSRHSLFSRH